MQEILASQARRSVHLHGNRRSFKLWSFLVFFHGLILLAAPAVCFSAEAALPPPSLRTPVLPPGFTDQNQKATPLTAEEAQMWFRSLARRKDIPYRFAYDGCYARAHKMALVLEQNGIISLKLYVIAQPEEKSFRVSGRVNRSCGVFWKYHVATAVLVIDPQASGGYRLVVLDPALYDRPVDGSYMVSDIGNSNGGAFRWSYEPRFSYKLHEPYNSTWLRQDLIDMNEVNRTNLNLSYRCDFRAR